MSSKKKELEEHILNELQKYNDDIFFGEELEDLAARLKNLYSSIVVIGQFSVGKSALLNALLGEELLFTRRVESTKVLTRIRFCTPAMKPSITLIFLDGSEESFPIKSVTDLEKYTTFQGEEVTDKLKYVDIYWPLPFLDEQLMLIDTPGANSLTASAFKVTEEALKEASAVVFLFNGQKGIDTTDYSLLTSLTDKKKRIFLVATHIDNLNDSDWQLIETNVREKLDEYVQGLGLINIYPVSSIKALQGKKTKNKTLLKESGLLALENDLFEYMDYREYEHSKINSIEHDLELLLYEISQSEEALLIENEAIKKEKQRRLERLVLLTRQEYQEVLLYGEKILKDRFKMLEYYLIESDETLRKLKKQIKERVQSEFIAFRKEVMANVQSSMYNIRLKDSFNSYEEQTVKLYEEWHHGVSVIAQNFQNHLLQVTKKDDTQFIHILEDIDTKIQISWGEFKQQLVSIELKNIDLELEKEDIDLYQQELKKIEFDYIKTNQLQEKIRKDSDLEQERHKKKLQRLRQKEKHDLEQLGLMPKTEYYTTSRRKFLFFKEEISHEDDSKQQRWKENIKKIKEEHEKLLTHQRTEFFQLLRGKEEKMNELNGVLEKIEEKEERLHSQFMRNIVDTLNNNSEMALKTYREMEEDLEASWDLHKRYYLQQLEKHVDDISEKFQNFVLQAQEQQISILKVN